MKPQRALLVTLAFVVAILSIVFAYSVGAQVMEAPTGFDNLTNGLVSQATHDADRAIFEQVRTQGAGLGPTYNRTNCAECHISPVSGGVSTFADLLAGSGNPVVSRLVHENAICVAAQDPPPGPTEITTRRLTLNTLGDGYVESLADATFSQIQASQPASMRGTILLVPVGVGATAVGRFGWKDPHVSLQAMAANQFRDEIGITNPLFPNELTTTCDAVADPEDTTNDFDAVARFIRAAKAPPRDAALAATPDAIAGGNLFNAIGCNVCHVTSLTTAPPGTLLQGGTYVVPAALGNKIIHPYSDFLLHNIGTSDGFPATPKKMRTAPLWGLRTHQVYLHDGASLSLRDAIQRHAGEATGVIQSYNALSSTQKSQLITFLQSL
jgi:CxxC motif-containing protein (DUF1111 family)